MPVVLRKKICNCDVVLWRIDESPEELCALCSPEEQEYVIGFNRDKRKKEWLAWHAALKELLPDSETAYNNSGAPLLNTQGFISVSHTSGYAAVAYNETSPCGIDIESTDRDFSKATPRITTPNENTLAENIFDTETQKQAFLWCAKEALFKWAGEKNIDFTTEISISKYNPANNTFHATARKQHASGQWLFTENLCIVCCSSSY